MKLSLLVALAIVAAVSTFDITTHSVVYKPGEEYVYHYKGQVLSGIPMTSKQFSGLLIDTLVILQFRQDNRVVMKLDKITLFKINNEITTSPSEPLSHSDVTRLTGEQANVLTNYLVKPLKFKYEEGEVRDIEKESRDRYWSVNIKKGILSLFQVTLKEKRSLSDSLSLRSNKEYLSVKSSKDFSTSPLNWNPAKHNSVYKVMESDVTGDCETKYTLIHDKTRMSMSVSTMHVTSVRNYDNCLEQPFYIQGIFQGLYVHGEEKDLIQPFVHTDYIITGDRTHFLIKEAVLRGKYLLMPNGLEGIAMSSFVYQSLKLRTNEPITNAVHLVDPKPETRGLLMVIPKSKVIPETERFDESELYRAKSLSPSKKQVLENEESSSDEDSKNIDDSDSKDEDNNNNKGERNSVITVVEEKLSELVRCLYPATDKQCTDILVTISPLLRTLSKEQLNTLIMRHIRGESDTDYRKSEILLDILPTLTTDVSAKVLIELIRERHISEFRGAILVNAMSLVVKPTPAVVKVVLGLFKELPKEAGTILSQRRFLRKTLLLSVGTITHRLINVMRSHDKPIPEVISFLDTISSTLKQMLEETTREPEKVLILKAMGNMGTSELIPVLRRLLEDRMQSTRVRVTAVFALRRLAKQFQKQVVPILMSSFMDIKEDHEVRRAAFVVIIDSNPSFLTLQLIAHLIRNEPSSRIRTLVYSSLINLALYTSHVPEHKELKKNARLVIKTIPAIPVGVHDTMSLRVSKFSEDLDLGASFNLKKYKSKMSGLPEALNGNLQATLFGKHRHLLEAGAEGKALEVLLRKIFGPHGLLKDILKGSISFSDVLKPLTRPDMGGLDRKIKELLEKMKLELQTENEPLAEWYIHVFGHELGYIVLNSENVEDLAQKLTNYLPQLFAKLTRGVKVDIIKTVNLRASLTIASPLGIPLFANFTTSSIFKVDGHIRIKDLPSWSELYRFPVSIPKMTLEVDLKPTVETASYFVIGAYMRWITTTTGFESKLRTTVPIKLDVILDGPKHTVDVKYYNPGKSVKMEAKFTPFIIFFQTPMNVANLPFKFEIKEIKNEEIMKVTRFEYKYKCPKTNVEYEARGQYSICGTRWCPTMFGKQQLALTIHPASSIEYIFMKIKSLRTNFMIEGVPASQRNEELYSDEDEDSREAKPNYKLSPYESVQFDPIITDPIFENEPIKRQICVTFGANTHRTPYVKTLITWLAGRRLLKHQLNVQVIHNAQGSLPAWKLTMNEVTDLLAVRAIRPWTNPQSSYDVSNNDIVQKINFLFKYGNSEAEELKIKIIPTSLFDISKDLLEHGIETADNLPAARAQKHKFTLEVEFKHMSSLKTLKYISDIKDIIKYKYYDQLVTFLPRSPVQNKLIVAIELLPWWEQMNLVVKTPIENIYIYDVPFYWNPFLPTSQKINLHDLSLSSWYRNSSRQEYSEDLPYAYGSSKAFDVESLANLDYDESDLERTGAAGECLVDYRQHMVNTYDGSDISLISAGKYFEKGCWTLLTQDCSNQRLFTVLAKNTHELKAITMLVPKYEIEFILRGSTLELMVNNEMMTLTTRKSVQLRGSDESVVLYTIEKKDSTRFTLKARELGVKLVINLERETVTLKVRPTSMLQGQLCGLCGNYNQDQSDEYLIPNNLKISSDRPVLLSHLVPSETCDIENIESTESENYCRKESKHVEITRDEDGTEVTCRSEKKISQCAEGCRPKSTRTVKTCFTCESEIKRLRKPYSSRWDKDDSITCEDFSQDIEVPTRCVPQY